MPTLYRTYRPSTFADVEAQEHVVTTLQNEIIAGTLAHSYLFSGPRGVGKTTLARLLAKAIICTGRQKNTAEPCNTCANCTATNAGNHIDVIEIDAASHTGVDNVRENIIENARFQPTIAPYKIFIIDEVHMLSTSAFNALLKTLEEPPAHVVFILATTELHKLPATVISRCQRFQFKRLGHDEIVTKLKKICAAEKITVEPAVLGRIAGVSDGALRDAESILGQLVSQGLKKITENDIAGIIPTADVSLVLGIVKSVSENNLPTALESLAAATESGADATHLIDQLIATLRDTLVFKTSSDDKIIDAYDSANAKTLRALAKNTDATFLLYYLDSALARRAQIRLSPSPYLPLELWIIGSKNPEFGQKSPVGGATVAVGPNIAPAEKSAPKAVREASVATVAPAPVVQTVTTPEPPKQSLGEVLKSAISTITGHTEPPKTALADIRAAWPELVQKISSHNHALTFILSMATVTAIEADGLHLTVPYSLHRDKLLENKNRRIMEECLEQKFGEKIKVECDVVSVTAAAPERPSDADLASVALEFGGEVMG